MASRALHALLLSARDQLASTHRSFYFAVVSLGLFHAAMLAPWIDGEHGKSAAASESERLRAVEEGIQGLESPFGSSLDEVSAKLGPMLERLVGDLEHDFARLEATRALYAGQVALEETAVEDGDPEEPFEPARGPAADAAPPFVIEDVRRLDDLRDAVDRDELLVALEPLVAELITEPRFFDLNQGWKRAVLPLFKARLDTVTSAIPRLHGRFPEARAEWDGWARDLSNLQRAADAVRFTAPDRPDWWWSDPGGKLVLGPAPAAVEQLRSPLTLDTFTTAAEQATASYGALLEQAVRASREHRGRSAIPASGWQRGAAPVFPLALGLVLGGLVLWRSGRLRELAVITRLEIEHRELPALGRFFLSQIHSGPVTDRDAASWRWCLAQTLFGYFLAMGWIAYATIELRRLDGVDIPRLMVFTAAGAVAVLLTVVHRLAVVRRSLAALRAAHSATAETAVDETLEIDVAPAEPQAPPPGEPRLEAESGPPVAVPPAAPSPPPEAPGSALGSDRDSGLLDIHTLRR